MKTHLGFLLLPVMGALVMPLAADTFLLRNGERIEGRVLREDAESCLIEVLVAKGIRDERTVPKSDIRTVIKGREDVAAFESVKALLPAPDGLSVSQYEERISKVEQFIQQHDASPLVPAAKSLAAQLRSELREVANGGVKQNGMLYSAEVRDANAYDIDAGIAARGIRSQIGQRQYLAALRAFTQFEQDFKPTLEYQKLLPEVVEAMRLYSQDVEQLQASFDSRVAERDRGLLSMSDQDRRNSEAAIREQQDLLQQRFENENKGKMEWVTPHPFCKDALKHAADKARLAMIRLQSHRNAVEFDGGALYREVLVKAREGAKADELAGLIRQAQEKGMAARYLERLRKASEQVTTSADPQP